MEAVCTQAGLSFRLPGRAAPRPTSRGPSGREAAAGFSALFSNHNRLEQQPDENSLVTNETDLASAPHKGAVSAHAGLWFRLLDVPRRDLPPGALAAAGFSVLLSNHNRPWRQPHKKALVTYDTDLASPTRLTWKL